ncbi:Uncharacterised protein [Mycobacteroides abscessus subsp. abscessus]|nr:Uncharacterised protein [Mycobacteroides abscessus subsp. abscessus]
MPNPRRSRYSSSCSLSPREVSRRYSVTPASCSEGQKRLPGRAKGALTAAVHRLGFTPTISIRIRRPA